MKIIYDKNVKKAFLYFDLEYFGHEISSFSKSKINNTKIMSKEKFK